ncbi:MAG: 16S rRNA (uracil(1498)-N(3))-methyltransferase [Rubrivivax sp.]|nr:16S rRNA (uracil(1498)-N(3))-methyltransferase [Rubrivivax sp.]
MALRLFIDPEAAALAAGAALALPETAARHAQVRRVQPGDRLVLFDGRGHEAAAEVLALGRREVTVRVGAVAAVERELPWAVTLALGMPTNERMDALVEKATELGAAALQPLLCERSVLRLAGERAERRRAHWQAVAVSASEQCGRTRVPEVGTVRGLPDWLAALPGAPGAARWLLSLDPAALAPAAALARSAAPAAGAAAAISGQGAPGGYGTPGAHATAGKAGTPGMSDAAIIVLSGPEGGLAPAEQEAARAAGFVPVGLGSRTLRADTAPLALLAWLGLAALGPGQG